MPRKQLIQQRRDTAANWTAADPTLAAGEIGFETDTGKFKVGDGSTAWSSLTYFVAGAGGSGAPTDASYVTLGTNGTLSAERVLTEGTGIDITDAGAGSTVTVAVDLSELSAGGDLSGTYNAPTIATGAVTSAKIADGAIVNEDINASAAIALSKLATDPLARANHTGTQTASTISDFDAESYNAAQTLNAQTDSYELVLGDAGKLVTLDKGTAVTLTVPANASVSFAVGTRVDLVQLGAGQVSVAITSDTLRSTPGAKLRAQYSAATLVKIASTEWLLVGDLSA